MPRYAVRADRRVKYSGMHYEPGAYLPEDAPPAIIDRLLAIGAVKEILAAPKAQLKPKAKAKSAPKAKPKAKAKTKAKAKRKARPKNDAE